MASSKAIKATAGGILCTTGATAVTAISLANQQTTLESQPELKQEGQEVKARSFSLRTNLNGNTRSSPQGLSSLKKPEERKTRTRKQIEEATNNDWRVILELSKKQYLKDSVEINNEWKEKLKEFEGSDTDVLEKFKNFCKDSYSNETQTQQVKKLCFIGTGDFPSSAINSIYIEAESAFDAIKEKTSEINDEFLKQIKDLNTEDQEDSKKKSENLSLLMQYCAKNNWSQDESHKKYCSIDTSSVETDIDLGVEIDEEGEED